MSKNRLTAKILLVLLGLMIGLLSVELALRFIGYDKIAKMQFANQQAKYLPTVGFPVGAHYTYDPITGFAMIPNIVDEVRKITTDENGFRITSRPIDPRKASVIFVGDSTVFGYLAPDQETFPYLLSTMSEFSDVNVINMGVPSYSVAHMTQVLKYKVPKFRPTLVFVQMLWPWKPFENYTSSPNAWKEVDHAFYKKTTALRTHFEAPKNELNFFDMRSIIMLRDAWWRILFRKQIYNNLSRPTRVYDFTVSEEVEKEIAWEHVREFQRASKALTDAGIRVVYYIHPFQYTLFLDQYKNLGTIGRQILMDQLKAVYLGDCILGRSGTRKEPLFIDACHMTRVGNAALAECFRELIRSNLARETAAPLWIE